MGKATKSNTEEWLTEEQACSLLGIKKNTIQNYVSRSIIPEKAISRGVRNKKFYHKPTLMGLEAQN